MDGLEVLVVVLIFFVSLISNAAKKGKEAARKQAERIRPVPLPNGDLLLPTGEIVPAQHARAYLATLPPPPAVPQTVSVPAGAPRRGAIAVPVYAGTEESSSELAVSDTQSLESIADTEGVTLEPPELADWEQMRREGRPEPVRAALESTEVDWNAEHERFHKKYVDVRQQAPAATHGALDSLRGPGALRRAILTAEVLGPPRALRPPDV